MRWNARKTLNNFYYGLKSLSSFLPLHWALFNYIILSTLTHLRVASSNFSIRSIIQQFLPFLMRNRAEIIRWSVRWRCVLNENSLPLLSCQRSAWFMTWKITKSCANLISASKVLPFFKSTRFLVEIFFTNFLIERKNFYSEQ